MHNKQLWIAATCLLLSLACNTLAAPIGTAAPIPTAVTFIEIPSAAVKYYDVSGSTEAEIRDQLDALSPVDMQGYRGDALTSWNIHWNWDGYGTQTCDLNSVTVNHDIEVLLPRWTPPQDASRELIVKWNTYIRALAEHEKVHVDNVAASLPDVIAAIRAATCDTAEARAQDVLAGIRQFDIDYDERTGHGETQGAIFP